MPLFTAIGAAKTPGVMLLLVTLALSLLAASTSVSALIKAELFPAHIRALGVAFPYAIGNTLFGGTAEYIALWFKSAGVESGFYWYVSALIAMATVGFALLPETRDTSLITED